MSHEEAKLPTFQTRGTSPVVWLVLGCTLLAGLLVRGVYFGELLDHPDYYSPARDAEFHDYWARALVTGHWMPTYGRPDPHIRETPFLRPPGYPYFLAMIYKATGISDAGPRLVQMSLGLLSSLLAFAFARRWYGASVGLVLAGLMSLYWVFVYYEGELHAPALLIMLLWLMAYLTARWAGKMSMSGGAASGVLLGLCALVRPNVLLLAPTILLWAVWMARRRHRGRALPGCGLGFIIGLAVVVAPATIRNYRVSGDRVLITSNAGVNLYIGNNPSADGFFSGQLPGLGAFGTCYDYPALVEILEKKQGKKLAASDVSAHFAGEAFRWIRSHPIDFVRVTATKMYHFWTPREVEHNKSIRCERANSTVLGIMPGNFGFVLGGCLVGVALLMVDLRKASRKQLDPKAPMSQRWEVTVLVIALVLTYFLSIIPFFVSARFRVPIIPFLFLFVAYGLCRIVEMMRSRESRRSALTALALIGLSGLAGWTEPVSGDELVWWHLQRARVYDRLAQNSSAIRAYRSAIRSQPANADAHFGLANVLRLSEHYPEAARHYRIVLRINPRHTGAREQLSTIQGLIEDQR